MTFHFPYLHILNLKEKEKEQAYLEFGRTIRKKELIQAEHKSFEQKRNEFLTQVESAKGKTSIADIQQRNEYLVHLTKQITSLEEKLNVIDQEIARKKSVLLTKQTDEKTWNHLRDKAFEKYVEKQKKVEQNLMDEMASIRHYHQSLSL
ncbi:flagellar export protein FliJ [Neobacillus sp. FSL H8-0543]|uniref:flagellar export protein FliJ n=1 Tax=Neobacillus sp. FSL H8-0543 TaxID=2954672 RepID=UPI003158F8EA